MEDEEAVTYAMTGLYYSEAKDRLDHLGDDRERSRWSVLKAYLEHKLGDSASRTENTWAAITKIRKREELMTLIHRLRITVRATDLRKADHRPAPRGPGQQRTGFSRKDDKIPKGSRPTAEQGGRASQAPANKEFGEPRTESVTAFLKTLKLTPESVAPPMEMSARGARPRRGAAAPQAWKALVDSGSQATVVSLKLAERMGRVVETENLLLQQAGRENSGLRLTGSRRPPLNYKTSLDLGEGLWKL
ncbi:hypothetical protein ACJ73_05568 [Blastomyces percursus]|uniref:Uncharacterized protein n=1 Tax=Blastomyces percursus TaxID=1658174 RepID=A0A1J9Q3F6_9EURO|nr:hypothetical protein ACJ73_05568 [Blastomyces percursus]